MDTGALVIAGLFCKKLSIDECIRLSKDASSPRSLLQPFANLPSQCSSTRINSVFKKALGPDKTLFEYSGTKLALVVTSTKDSSTHIFSNYNGPIPRPSDCG